MAVLAIPATVGRAGECDLVIEDEQISSTHLSLSLQDGALYVTDANSRNGTWFGSDRIDHMPLEPGRAVQLGDTTLGIVGIWEEETRVLAVDIGADADTRAAAVRFPALVSLAGEEPLKPAPRGVLCSDHALLVHETGWLRALPAAS